MAIHRQSQTHAEIQRIAKARARRDFAAQLVLIDPAFVPAFEWTEQQLAIELMKDDPVAAARAIAQRQKNIDQ